MIKLNTRLMAPAETAGDGGAAGATEAPKTEAAATTETTDATTHETAQTEENADGNMYAGFFDEEAEQTEAATEQTATDETFELGLTKDDGYSEAEIGIMSTLAQKYHLDKETRVGLFKEFGSMLTSQLESERKATEKAMDDNLRKDWGKDYQANGKRAAAFLKRTGAALGWSNDYMKQWMNPEGIKLAYDLSRAYGERNAVGTSQTETAAETMSKESRRDIMKHLVEDFYKAKQRGDASAADKASIEHHRHARALYGNDTPRMLV